MGQRERRMGNAEPGSDLGCAPMKGKSRPSARLAGDLNLQPCDAKTDPCAQRFGRGFLGSEPCRKALRRIALALAVSLLAGRKDAIQKTVAKSLNRIPDAWNFRQVDSRSDQ